MGQRQGSVGSNDSNEMRVDQDSEHQTYLRVAENVLRDAMSPLKAREIVERGIDRGLFGDHVHGRTPEKSMQARLSLDILNRGDSSRFARVARGRFWLRSRIAYADGSEMTSAPHADDPMTEYIAERRVLRLPNEEVLCVSEHGYRDVLTFQGIDTESAVVLAKLLRANTLYVPRSEAEHKDDAKQFVSYVMVQCGQRLLQFQRSYLSRAAEFLRGSRCIGFGGHVTAEDGDILSFEDRGLSACAKRELIEELRLASGSSDADDLRSTVRLFKDVILEPLGVLNDDSSEVGRRHVAVVYRAWLPDWEVAKGLVKGDSSIKRLAWLDISRDRVDLSEYEYWSQLCLRKFFPSNVVTQSSFKVLRKNRLARDGALVICGRIGSGKSETATYLSSQLGLPVLKSSEVLTRLMKAPPISEVGREKFQAMAQKFISDPEGPLRLASAIKDAVLSSGSPRCIIDGIRHLSTFEMLGEMLGKDLLLAFVQTPPDIAYDLYRAREATDEIGFTYRDFLRIYDAPVETEIPSLGRRADLYIYNAHGIQAFRRTLDEIVNLIKDPN